MITKCPCCGHISYEDSADIKELANEALDEAAALIQDKLGQTDGGLASHFFSDNRAIDNLTAYILTEIQWFNEAAKEVVDAGNKARIERRDPREVVPARAGRLTEGQAGDAGYPDGF